MRQRGRTAARVTQREAQLDARLVGALRVLHSDETFGPPLLVVDTSDQPAFGAALAALARTTKFGAHQQWVLAASDTRLFAVLGLLLPGRSARLTIAFDLNDPSEHRIVSAIATRQAVQIRAQPGMSSDEPTARFVLAPASAPLLGLLARCPAGAQDTASNATAAMAFDGVVHPVVGPLVARYWTFLASLAWRGYGHRGPGALLIRPRGTTLGVGYTTPSVRALAIQALVAAYDPQTQVAILYDDEITASGFVLEANEGEVDPPFAYVPRAARPARAPDGRHWILPRVSTAS